MGVCGHPADSLRTDLDQQGGPDRCVNTCRSLDRPPAPGLRHQKDATSGPPHAPNIAGSLSAAHLPNDHPPLRPRDDSGECVRPGPGLRNPGGAHWSAQAPSTGGKSAYPKKPASLCTPRTLPGADTSGAWLTTARSTTPTAPAA